MELSPYSLMALTFTNKARVKCKDVTTIVGVLSSMWVVLFMVWLHRYYAAHWRDARTERKTFMIMDSDGQLRLIKRHYALNSVFGR